MFGSKLLVYIKKPSIYNIRKIRSVQERKQTLQRRMLGTSSLTISPNNKQYAQAFQLIAKQKETQMMKYQKSVMFSPVYTPNHFKYMFLIPAFCVGLLIVYIHYIAQPKLMMKYKKKYGISLKQFEKNGRLDSWMDEYSPPDEVLTFEAYSVNDLEVLYKQGLLKGINQQQRSHQQARAKKRKSKFVSGSKQFVLKQFNAT